MKNKRGHALVELMILVAVVAIVLAIIVAMVGRGCTDVTGMDHKKAVNEAGKWGQEMGLDVKGVSCVNVDSNVDGYVSCSLSTAGKDGTISIVPIECAASLTINSGCRVARVIPVGGR